MGRGWRLRLGRRAEARRRGAGHVIGLPHVQLSGDTAVATGYARLYRWDGAQFVVARVSANRWELVRTAAGWRVAARTNRVLDGGDEPRALLRAGVTPTASEES